MPKVSRYTPEEIKSYLDSNYWTQELTADIWQRNAQTSPDQEAVWDGQYRLSWAQGWQHVERLTVGLARQGLSNDDTLLIQVRNSVWLMLLRLACERSGIIPAFLHHGFRRQEIEHIIGITDPVGAVISADPDQFDFIALYRELQQEHNDLRHLFKIDDLGTKELPSIKQLAEEGSHNPTPSSLPRYRFSPGDLTGIVTSSGTTGLPKSIEFSCAPRLASGRVYVDRLKLTEHDRIASLVPLYTGGADLSYHTAPQVAATQILLKSFSAQAACRLVEAERATGMVLVPTMLIRMMEISENGQFDFSPLRFITCFGSALPYDVAKRAEELFEAKIIQGYGLMDYGALASHSMDDPSEKRWSTNGRPLDGTELANVELLRNPKIDAAEIAAKGPHCVGGYVGNPAATTQVWQDGFFHTGDLGRLDDDGYLSIVGRSKDIIIRGGQNISASEVEAILAEHPDIVEAAAVKIPDPDLGERVFVFVISASGEPIEFEDMVQFMRDRETAKFKIPERLKTIDEFPLTAGGTKIDKKVLENWAARLSELS